MQLLSETEPRINAAINELCKSTLVKFTCQIFENNSTEILPFASGVFVLLGDNYYIFTAAHVLASFNEERVPLVRYKDGFISLVGTAHETDIQKDKTIDLAYIKLDPRIIEQLKLHYKFLTIDKIRQHQLVKLAANYLVIGYPTKNQYHDDQRLRTGACSLVLQPCDDRVYQYYQLDVNACYILELKGKGIDLATSEPKKVSNEFYGFSGCGLWQLILHVDGDDVSVDFKLIGVMTEYRKGKYYCLIGNRIELLLQGLVTHQGLKIQPKNIEFG